MHIVYLYYASSYLSKSTEFLRARRTAIWLSAFLAAPLLSIPGALLFPFFAISDTSVGLEVRILMMVVVALTWRVWLTSQKALLPSIGDIALLASGCSRQRQRWLDVFRYLLFCWPLGVVVLALFFVADSHERWICVSLWTLGVVAFSSIGMLVPWNRVSHFSMKSTSWLVVLATRAGSDVAPLSDAARFARYLGNFFVVACAAYLCGNADQAPFARYHFAVGLAVACLPLRGLLGAAADKDKRFGSLHVCSPAYKILVSLRCGWVVLFFNGVVYAVFGHFARTTQDATFDWTTLAAVSSFMSACILLGQLVKVLARWDGALLFLPLGSFIIGDLVS